MEIKFENVTLTSSAPKIRKKLINNLSITIKPNQITGFIGSSGSGKSTILKLINAIILPTKGKIIIGDKTVERKTKLDDLAQLKRKIGLVHQEPKNYFLNSTIKKEIEFALVSFNYKLKDTNKRIINSLKMSGLDESYLNRNPLELSTGEQKKVSLAMALSYNPTIILLDEPTLGLDDKDKRQLIKIIRMMKLRYNKTIVISSSDIDFIYQIADYLYVFDNGQLALEGTKYEIFKERDLMNQLKIELPTIIKFTNMVKDKKGINLGYRDDLNDLAKDIYRNVT